MVLYPFTTAPFYRSGSETQWGGNMLSDCFMKDAPAQTGESLEVSADIDSASLVRDGSCAGRTLAAMVNLWGTELIGATETAMPVQIKLIDVAPEADAPAIVSSTSRVWVILNCDPDASVTLNGITVSVHPGDVYYIPANTESKVGSAMQIYELSASDACRTVLPCTGERIFGTTSLCKGGSRTYYVSDERIELCRLNVFGKMPLDDERMLVLMPFAPCVLNFGEESSMLMPFNTVIIPAGLNGVTVESDDCKIMLASVSNRNALRADLGYRAENVTGLVD